MRTWRPGPLDERGKSPAALGGEELNPQLQDQNLPCCRLHHPRMGAVSTPTRPSQRRTHNSESRYEPLHLAMPVEAVVAEDPSRGDTDGLGAEPPPFARTFDRAREGGRRRPL